LVKKEESIVLNINKKTKYMEYGAKNATYTPSYKIIS